MRADPKKGAGEGEREARWRRALRQDELPPGSLATFKTEGHQLVLGRADDGAPFALDNRCPHEGYPLAQGALQGCALTCAWHNWKFDVRDGRCTLGGEDVRVYPVRVVDGTLEVDLAEPEPAALVAKLRASLAQGLFHHDDGRVLRDGVRLLRAGYSPHELLAEAAVYDARHAEYGTTHVLPVAADCARLLARHPGLEALYAIAPALDLCGESNRRLPPRALPAPVSGASGAALRAAVESEDAARAEGLLRGAFAAGVERATIEAWLYDCIADHFLDFGHPLIYLVKAQELLARVDEARAAELYPALLLGVVLGTREDTLPYMRAYSERLRAVESELPAIHARVRAAAHCDGPALRAAVLDASPGEAFDALWGALCAGVSPDELARVLVGAAAQRLYRFDAEVDASPDVAETWLWATHRFTFASAVRNALVRQRTPDVLRFLFQALAFIHSGRGMDAPSERRLAVQPAALDVDEIVAAVARKDVGPALAGVLGLVRAGAPIEPLRDGLLELCLRDPLVRPIFLAHAIKTTTAGFEEYAALAGHPERELALLGAVRFLATPMRERRVHASVTTSIRWVADGIVPRKLTQ